METNYVTKEALDRVEKRFDKDIKKIERQVTDNKKDIIKLQALYNSLIKLPDTIASLERTVIGVNHSLERINERMDLINNNIKEQSNDLKELRQENKRQNDEIEAIDNKSKIDWSVAITTHFWKIIVALGAIYLFIKDLF